MNPIQSTTIKPISPDFGTQSTGQSSGGSFSDTLKNVFQQAQENAQAAHQEVSNVLTGQGGEDLHSAVLAVEKANLSFELMMQVRNKIVSAYQEVSRMQF